MEISYYSIFTGIEIDTILKDIHDIREDIQKPEAERQKVWNDDSVAAWIQWYIKTMLNSLVMDSFYMKDEIDAAFTEIQIEKEMSEIAF